MDILGFYPMWYVPTFGSAFSIAIIATIHVMASHTSVGASILLAYLATKAYKENLPQIYDYIKKYLLGLLVFSYVSGSITGPGIWFSATVANPRGISALIHNFVWVWAAEWIWFIAEVTLVYILFYTLGKIDQRSWLRLAWTFAIGSWATMYIIVGILSFMLSPGHEKWFATGNILDAFYNKNYFPHLLMRSSFMFAIAGTIGIVIASLMKKDLPENVYKSIVKTMSYWGIAGLIFGSMFFAWYVSTLPERSLVMLSGIVPKWYYALIFTILVVLLAHFVITAIRPTVAKPYVAYPIYLLIFFLGVYPEEKIRETIRKPYVAGEFVWVNQIIARDVPAKGIKAETETIKEKGLLQLNPFVPEGLRTITPENKIMAGKAIAILQCSGCHNVTGSSGLRPFGQKFAGMTSEDTVYNFLANYLTPQNHPPYMPYFVGKDEELRALSAYIADMISKGGSVSAKIEVPKQASAQR
ncbi:MAG TPA: cytochrome C [Aquificaceae bacterium]|jgi:cytochrome c553|uniref:Cytochrome c n=1 Tax=Hydrogenobacter sp. TaxID=2152829 RepID=A0A7C2V9B9_9AQUI|nr:cytochrome c [Aquificaceae bacterium]QWK13046.1 MAG: cytochrome c [Aquificota bacterium]HAV40384.1 cytochrome C [Aquificaceae bacterium]HCO38897.1 cytochrome C [Aquificaceae bacterium]